MERLTIEYCGEYIPKELCCIDRLGYADDCELCAEYCDRKIEDDEDDPCRNCAISRSFNRLGIYENAQEKIEKRIQEIKSNTNLLHNLEWQTIENLEWVLKLFNAEGSKE